MIKNLTKLRVIDNTGVVLIKCIGTLNKKKDATIGDIIVASVLKRNGYSKFKKGDIVKALIVHCKKEYKRIDNTYIIFSDNAAVLLNDKKEPLGTNILNFLPFEIKKLGFIKLFSIAKFYI